MNIRALIDWRLVQKIHKQGERKEDIKTSFKESLRTMAKFLIAFAIEHFFLLLPVIVLKAMVDQRNSLLIERRLGIIEEEVSQNLLFGLSLNISLTDFCNITSESVVLRRPLPRCPPPRGPVLPRPGLLQVRPPLGSTPPIGAFSSQLTKFVFVAAEGA